MKNFFALLLLGLLISLNYVDLYATHIVGGVMNYQCLDPVSKIYQVTLKVYKDCSPSVTGVFDEPGFIYVMKADGTEFINFGVNLTPPTEVPINIDDPCITIPDVCVQEGIYSVLMDFDSIPLGGLTLMYQRCCRNNTIANINLPGEVGSTYSAFIPDSTVVACNANPIYNNFPPLVICVNIPLEFDHSATDLDGDSLVYSICSPSTGASTATPIIAPPTLPTPFVDVPWLAPYSAVDMLGGTPPLNIDPITGLLTANPSTIGQFVVGVCVTEYRDGVMLSTTKRDFQFNVTSCLPQVTASTPSLIANCEDLNITFLNESTGEVAIESVIWDFGVTTSTIDTSTLFSPTFTYPDTGVYYVTLIANPGLSCADTATSEVRIFPILTPNFSFVPACTNNPVVYTDASTVTYGALNYWHWIFGDGDTADVVNPTHSFTLPGTYTTTLVVGTTTGCLDTISQDIEVFASPVLTTIADTTICANDEIVLLCNSATATVFNWSPLYEITGETTSAPVVSPNTTTTYSLTYSDALGCVGTEEVVVEVVNTITPTASSDVETCAGDTILLNASGGFEYSWSPATNISNTAISNPLVFPSVPTIYTVTVSIGSCSATETVFINSLPKPVAQASNDTIICLGESVMITASGGSSYLWNSESSLSSLLVSSPIATPNTTTAYIVAVSDTAACDWIDYDTVQVEVDNYQSAYAGPDQLVIIGTPAMLSASGGVSFVWEPSTGLSNVTIANPTFTPNEDILYILTATNENGCVDIDSVFIKAVNPYIVVPNAFTPNGDIINSTFAPKYIGIGTLQSFEVWNRWGEMIYQTTDLLGAWDGNFQGKEQPIGTYVWRVKAIDQLGNAINKSGNLSLIR